ncbi:CC0125/CC1285 family lipoprotein [Bacterioplanoides sp.]|uniref:CC0125/CC1285 family lipoprotein n=1 Tax=Bacterioplanoides sp. TaxID=2066072 RepID=UPI003B5A2F5D
MKKWIILSLAAVLAGCGATPYHRGYGDSQLGPDTYRIHSVVNGFSARTRAEGIALLRAAEIACVRGYEGFKVTEKTALYEGSITHATITVDVTPMVSEYDARFLLDSLSRQLEAKIRCKF